MNKTVDVVVIGAGVIGCAISYYLAKKGSQVVVIEKEGRIGSGASSANIGGSSFSQILPESPIFEMKRASLKLYETLSEEIDYDIEFEKVGSLTCTDSEAQYPSLRELGECLEREGIARLIEGAEIRKQEPTLGANIHAGIEDCESGILNPFKVTHGFARAAKRLGAEYLLGTIIQGIETEKDKVTSVLTQNGKIKTDWVVVAAGVWSPEIARMVGLTVPIEPIKGQVIVTEPVPFNRRWRYILNADSLRYGKTPAADSKEANRRLGITGSWIQEKSGNWLLGTSHERSLDKTSAMQALICMARRAMEFMPMLKHVNCIRTYAGLRPRCRVDGLPIIGKVDKLRGLVLATGHFGSGVGLAPMTGKVVAELILENKAILPLDVFSFSRFKNLN